MLADLLSRNFPSEIGAGRPLTAEQERDLDLIRRIAEEDESAMRELYAAYGQRLYAYALRLMGVPAIAEDVVQDTLVAVWRSASRFRGEGRVLAWLLGILHHTAMKALRHQPLPITEEMESTLAAPADCPEEQVWQREQRERLRRGLQDLTPEHRAVLELVFYQGLSLSEVAKICGCPVGTVKSRLCYARKQLRGILIRQEEAA